MTKKRKAQEECFSNFFIKALPYYAPTVKKYIDVL